MSDDVAQRAKDYFQVDGTPTFPPFAWERNKTWKCLLFGCIYQWVRADAWWEREECRWCHSSGDVRQSPVARCASCGRRMPGRSLAVVPPPPPPNDENPGRPA